MQYNANKSSNPWHFCVYNISTCDFSCNKSFIQLCYIQTFQGYCSEIYDLKCERRCDSKEFVTTGKNTVIFQGTYFNKWYYLTPECNRIEWSLFILGERIIITECDAISATETSRFIGPKRDEQTLVVACSNILK